MKILVTGASGFIAKNLVEYFSAKYQVFAPLHKELELIDDDAVKSYLSKHKFDVIIHCAVRPGHRNAKDCSDQLYHNSRMFFNLVRNSDKFKKMIFLSSGLVYDIRHYQPKMKEDYFDTHLPADEGGLSKYIAAKYIEMSDNIIELRLFGVFGKYEDYAIRFISNAICKTLFDLPITIKQNRKFDYMYINDLFVILDYFINKKGKFRSYNVATGSSIELLKLAEIVSSISGKDLPIRIAKRGMGPEYSADNSRLRGEIKNLRFTPIEAAVKELFEWYLRNVNSIKKDLLLVDK